MTSVFSKEPNPDKKTRLREVATDFVDIPGDTFIHFDKIVKEQILNQIDKEKFMSDTNQKKAYFVFRKDNGNRMPYLTDYIKHGSDLDPCVFSKIKKGNLLYHSYFEFVASAENEINSSESVILNQLSQNNIFTTFIRFIDSLLPAKRIEERCVINQLISNSNFSASINEIKDSLQKYVDYYNEASLNNACSFLAGKFFDTTETKTYKDVIMSFDGETISLNQNVKELFSSTNNDEISKWINEYIEYALLRYDEDFGRNDYGFPFLKPYAKYSMRNIAPLCNYEKIHSSFRGSGLLTSAKPQYFIFVDLYKADDIREEINYHDKFISSNVFQWQSPNNMTQDSDRGKDVIKNTERHTHLHLFVRKFKEVESIPQEFIYLGEVSTMLDTAKGECPVTMNFSIPELPADLYNDFITDVDKTKIEEKE